MLKDLRCTVHLAQNHNHFFVDELLELAKVARHVHFQLGSDLWDTSNRHHDQDTDELFKPTTDD